MKKLLANLVALVYPPTKAKLHRVLHALLTLAAVGASLVVWVQGQRWGWSTWNQIEAQSVIVGTFLARAQAVFKRLDAGVDKLPIPSGDTPKPTPKAA